jgi:hypothetical protein
MCWGVFAADGHTERTMSASKPPSSDLPGDLLRVADEIRVRIHLAGMEAKDAWTKLEPRVKELERKLGHATDRAAAELDEVGRTLRHELDRLHKSLFG